MTCAMIAFSRSDYKGDGGGDEGMGGEGGRRGRRRRVAAETRLGHYVGSIVVIQRVMVTPIITSVHDLWPWGGARHRSSSWGRSSEDDES